MKYAIFGTGMVGRTIAGKLGELGYEVMIGTRDVASLLARSEPDQMGNPPFAVWRQQYPRIKLGRFTEAAAYGDMLVNATSGQASLDVLRQAGESNLNGKVLIDISNPLDFSKGMPPSLSVSNTDSLGEQIQRTFPGVRVVKTLNTMTARLMVKPQLVADGDHHVFVSGNDPAAKQQVIDLLVSGFGWKNVIDLGDITTARGVEMVLPLWLTLMGVMKTSLFSFKVVQ